MPIPGLLYFLREADRALPSSERGNPYVKIGIVKGDKSVEKRIDELQTGNPRRIQSASEALAAIQGTEGGAEMGVRAVDIQPLETAMHGSFASRRVRGEWFHLATPGDVKEAIRVASELAAEQHSFARELEEAAALAWVASKGEPRPASPEERELQRELIALKEETPLLTARMARIEAQLQKVSQRAPGIDGILDLALVPTSRFDEAGFRRAHPELAARFAEEKSGFRGVFRLSGPRSLQKLDPELDAERRAFPPPSEIESGPPLARNPSLAELHASYLGLLAQEALAKWKTNLLTAQLQARLGDAPGILDLCSWNRVETSGISLSKKALKMEFPEVFEAFSSESATIRSSVSRWRDYPISEWAQGEDGR
jgi:hypothetical protein